ncbi:SDR family oxidoreductase [Myxococcus sp. RHSTA-1-4]|uniref:SDR family oxidoreductase n=1 Tax=Myxococcus sp. RHSTA-1-4 TaxID=2874601 RepID=UPI001CBB45DB|nr:SDR family oxidoreductase [Myxococcus sp. RHSTA-1-4]MBZ4418492.1 SDR family oxidoreductase [Myxococcus sp. RHSTA-1-4]
MRVFITGATGFIGSAIVQELLAAGHRVVGLARSDAAARALAAAGAEVHRGDIEDLDGLRRAAAASDGVIHNGFIHDFTRYKEACEIDRRAIEALGAELVGSDRPLVVTSGTALVAPGRLATEDDAPGVDSSVMPRVATEEAAAALVARGARVSLVRLPVVHGKGDHGFVPMLIALAREKGVSAYVGDGRNRWNAAHRLDAARLFKLALEKAPAGARLHAVAEEAIAFREIAEVIGRRLDLPVVARSAEDAASHFGWFVNFARLDFPASSKLTQERFGWRPVQPSLIADLESESYFES